MKKYSIDYVSEVIGIKLTNYFSNCLNLSSDDREKLLIGATVILFNMLEVCIVFTLAFLLGILKETMLFTIMFVPLRMLAAGVHCKTGSTCLLITVIFYIGSSLLCKYCPIRISYAIILGIMCIIAFLKYAPADTENRPILGEKHRRMIKIKTISIAVLILVINILIKNATLFNCAMYALIIETVSILPLTYKIFNYTYNNYKFYE